MVLIATGMAFIATEAMDCVSRPRGTFFRAFNTMPLRLLVWLTCFGILQAFFGNLLISSILIVLLSASFVTGSNLKFRILGEPLVFSDLAIIAAAFRFPRLYLFAIPNTARCAIVLGLVAALLCIISGFVPDWRMHVLGIAVAAASLTILELSLGSSLMQKSDLYNDVRRHGVVLTLFFYWRRWLVIRNTPIDACTDKVQASAELIIIVQNESFCDPRDLAVDKTALRGLNAARQKAWAWGNLGVSSFGAYTMRAEYGVLCGVEESQLGFRRYDPFLTAGCEAFLSLPARLPAYQSIFLHPYDLRFFGRNDVMQCLGFDEILGAASMPAPSIEEGPYVSDLALAEKLTAYIKNATSSLIYTVTMENHGPWTKGRVRGQPGGLFGYLHHLRNSDAMLEILVEALQRSKRDAVLAFFGDHRPSIPGVIDDGAERHTPYVLLKFNNGECVSGAGRLDLTPAALHHAILAAASVVCEAPSQCQSSQVFDISSVHS
jgi:hypothetical protein